MIDWKSMDISQELVIVSVVVITLYMGDKDIANVAIGGLIGFLAKKTLEERGLRRSRKGDISPVTEIKPEEEKAGP